MNRSEQVAVWQENLNFTKRAKIVCLIALNFFVLLAYWLAPEMFQVRRQGFFVISLIASMTFGIIFAEQKISQRDFSKFAKQKELKLKRALQKIREWLSMFQVATFAGVLLAVSPSHTNLGTLPGLAATALYYVAIFMFLCSVFLVFMEKKIFKDYLINV